MTQVDQKYKDEKHDANTNQKKSGAGILISK